MLLARWLTLCTSECYGIDTVTAHIVGTGQHHPSRSVLRTNAIICDVVTPILQGTLREGIP